MDGSSLSRYKTVQRRGNAARGPFVVLLAALALLVAISAESSNGAPVPQPTGHDSEWDPKRTPSSGLWHNVE